MACMAAMLFCFPVQTSLMSDNRLLSYGQKRLFKSQPSAIFNFKISHIWSSRCSWVPNLHLCTIILNFMGRMMDSSKTSCRTSYRSLVETIACSKLLSLWKIGFLCTHFGDGQANKRSTNWQLPCVKPLSLSRYVPNEVTYWSNNAKFSYCRILRDNADMTRWPKVKTGS